MKRDAPKSKPVDAQGPKKRAIKKTTKVRAMFGSLSPCSASLSRQLRAFSVQLGRKELQDLFRMLSGGAPHVRVDALRRGARTLGLHDLSPEDCHDMLALFSKNGEPAISQDEFMELMELCK